MDRAALAKTGGTLVVAGSAILLAAVLIGFLMIIGLVSAVLASLSSSIFGVLICGIIVAQFVFVLIGFGAGLAIRDHPQDAGGAAIVAIVIGALAAFFSLLMIGGILGIVGGVLMPVGGALNLTG